MKGYSSLQSHQSIHSQSKNGYSLNIQIAKEDLEK